MPCDCDPPHASPDPRRKGGCVCGRLAPEGCWSSDETLGEFLDRLEQGVYPNLRRDELPPDWLAYRELCEGRERMGRQKFGIDYLARDNASEAQEEAADLGMYMHLELLRARRNGDDEEWDLALNAALHAFRAFAFCRRLQARRKGTP